MNNFSLPLPEKLAFLFIFVSFDWFMNNFSLPLLKKLSFLFIFVPFARFMNNFHLLPLKKLSLLFIFISYTRIMNNSYQTISFLLRLQNLNTLNKKTNHLYQNIYPYIFLQLYFYRSISIHNLSNAITSGTNLRLCKLTAFPYQIHMCISTYLDAF